MKNPLIIKGDVIYTKSKNVKYNRQCNTCKKQYIGWGKLYCSKKCRQQPKMEKSSSWRGDNIKPQSGRDRANKIFTRKPCQECGNKKSEIHHIDGNPINNSVDNIMFLCRKHHIGIEKRWLFMLKARSPHHQA